MAINIRKLYGSGVLLKDDKTRGLSLRDGKSKKTWYFTKKHNGRCIRVVLGTYPEMSISQAREAVLLHSAKLNAGITQSKYHATLRDVFLSFCGYKEGIKRSLEQNKKNFEHHLILWQHIPIKDITKSDIMKMRASMADKPYMFNSIRALLSTLFNHAIRQMDIDITNPIPGVPKFPETPREVIVPIDKMAEFLDELDKPIYPEVFRNAVKIMVYLGKRPGNTFALKWSELDLANGIIHIKADKSKNKHDIIGTLPDEAIEIFRKIQKQQKSKYGVLQEFVFYCPESATGHIVDIRKQLRKVAKVVGIDENIRPHDLRRTHGTWMLNAGASIEQVSRSLDHSSIAITQKVYAKVRLESLRQGQSLLTSAISKARKKSN